MTRLYLDVCCLGRLEDDQGQARIRLEANAVEWILGRIAARQWEWIASEVVDAEVDRNPDPARKARARMLMRDCERVAVGLDERERAEELEAPGFGGADALHLACAESGGADVFLTTDDKLGRLARRAAGDLKVRVENPLNWLMEMMP